MFINVESNELYINTVVKCYGLKKQTKNRDTAYHL